MVFKGRFFSSKNSDNSSSDGSSNSPSSFGSNSPIRSDEKKAKSGSFGSKDGGSSGGSKKEVEGKDTLLKSSSSSQGRELGKHSSGFSTSLKSRLQNAESSTEAGGFTSSWGKSGGPRSSDAYTPDTKTSYECDNPKESESPRFQAILRLTSAPRKRFPGDIKSFSHELNSKGVRPFPFWKPRGLNNLEEVLGMIRARFDKAKEEVDADLHIFAADLVGVLEKNAESHPEWQETIEDLLVLARSCAMTPASEFWLQCEGIVQELDDRRQELPMGMLKQLHTRMLFILTRCTRLLQFHKESGFAEDENTFQLRQSL